MGDDRFLHVAWDFLQAGDDCVLQVESGRFLQVFVDKGLAVFSVFRNVRCSLCPEDGRR